MDLVLALPGLLDLPDERAAHAPALAALLAGARATAAPEGLLAVVAARYGLARQRDWPIAPLRAAAAGLAVGERYWLRAVPITLVAGRDDVRVGGPVQDLDHGDAQALIALLNDHFRDDGLEFVARAPEEWLASCAQTPALVTRPLRSVVGRALRPLLPGGADASRWRRWDHEIQMLLHEHAVNRSRENAGLLPVNAVWLDEGGVYPTEPPQTLAAWASDAGVDALARWAHAPLAPVPEHLAAVLENRAPRALVMLSEPIGPGALDAPFAAPARAAWERGRLERLTILVDAPGRPAVAFEPVRAPAWRRWLGLGAAEPLGVALARARSMGEG